MSDYDWRKALTRTAEGARCLARREAPELLPKIDADEEAITAHIESVEGALEDMNRCKAEPWADDWQACPTCRAEALCKMKVEANRDA